MRVIGLIGGMSWESTSVYYRIINQEIRNRLGGLCSAKVLLYSLDFSEIAALQKQDDWAKAGEILSSAAKSLETAGAECIVICTNTMHLVADAVAREVSIPLIHILDVTANAIVSAEQSQLGQSPLVTVGLLGTKFTMERDFFRSRLESSGKLRIVTPDADDRDRVHRIIFEELCRGEIKDSSREDFKRIVSKLAERGATGVILGCTEIGLLIEPSDLEITVYDTTTIHALMAVEFALTN